MNTKRRAHCQLWHDWKERIIRIGDDQTSLQNQFDNFRNEYSDYPALIEGLETTVNGFDGRLIIAESDIADAENRISACENDIDSLESEVNSLDGRVTITESDISAAETRISACENDIESLETEVNALDGRVSITETDIVAAENRIATCENDIDSLESEVNSLDGRVSITESDISAAKNRITACENDIDSLESEVNSLDGRVSITESDISDAEDRISACEADIDRIDAELVDKTGEINALANRMSLAEADIDDIDARLDGIETGEILLSQLVPDADKDMAGKALNNVKINANELTVRGSQIEATRINNDILLWDGQELIDNRLLSLEGNAQYVDSVDGEGCPYRTYIKSESGGLGLVNYITPFSTRVPVTPGDRITITLLYKKTGGSYFTIHRTFFDRNKNPKSSGYSNVTANSTDWTRAYIHLTVPEDCYYVNSKLEIQSNPTVQICGYRIYSNYNFKTDITAKNIAADGVIIKDGGTVDGVDISAHTHNGTAVGGPKINASNIIQDASHRFVTDSEKSSWNAKWDYDENTIKSVKVNKAKDADTVSGFTVAKSVPSDAKFSDTTYSEITTAEIDAGTASTLRTMTGRRAKYILDKAKSFVDTHEAKTSNPHGVTKAQVGLGNVDNIKQATKAEFDAHNVDDIRHITASERTAWNSKADGSIFTPAKAVEWDGKARPPVPFKKAVSINLAHPSGYIDVLDIIPSGRTGLTVEQLQFRLIANIVEGTGPLVKICLIYDDNTISGGIDLISKNGNTDWHPPSYYALTGPFTQKYVKGIRIQRTPESGANITGYVDIIGQIY